MRVLTKNSFNSSAKANIISFPRINKRSNADISASKVSGIFKILAEDASSPSLRDKLYSIAEECEEDDRSYDNNTEFEDLMSNIYSKKSRVEQNQENEAPSLYHSKSELNFKCLTERMVYWLYFQLSMPIENIIKILDLNNDQVKLHVANLRSQIREINISIIH